MIIFLFIQLNEKFEMKILFLRKLIFVWQAFFIQFVEHITDIELSPQSIDNIFPIFSLKGKFLLKIFIILEMVKGIFNRIHKSFLLGKDGNIKYGNINGWKR